MSIQNMVNAQTSRSVDLHLALYMDVKGDIFGLENLLYAMFASLSPGDLSKPAQLNDGQK